MGSRIEQPLQIIGEVIVDHAERVLDHLAAIVDLGHDPVGTVALIGGDGPCRIRFAPTAASPISPPWPLLQLQRPGRRLHDIAIQ